MNDILEMKKYIFASLFINANRLQNACEKIQKEITMKQWLMLAIASTNNNEKNLTELAELMGCSRQNIKKLTKPLVDKGYIELSKGKYNSTNIKIKDKFNTYSEIMSGRHLETLRLLFFDFDENDLLNLYSCFSKLDKGLKRVENYGESLYETK